MASIGVLIYTGSFSLGMGGIPWVIMSEVFIKGTLIGGAEIINQLNEVSGLRKILKILPLRERGILCDACCYIRITKEAARIRDSLRLFEEEEPVLRLRRLLKEAIAEERFQAMVTVTALISSSIRLSLISDFLTPSFTESTLPKPYPLS